MKKRWVIFTIFINVCLLLFLSSCRVSGSVKSISLKSDEEVISVETGKFNYSDYTLEVTYSNKIEEVTLTEDMIKDYDKLKLYQVGSQTITITYQRVSCEVNVIVTRATLSDIVFESKTATYTGSAITMEVEGYIPADVTVRYPNGNSFVNAGTYNVTAICYGDNYETLELSATLIIVKTSYDTSGITFADATYTYDKGYKSISVKGDLPTGVSVSYKINGNSGNSAVNAGTYSVVASFTSTNSNYDAIPDMSATLTINKADYSSVSVTMEDLTVTYDGTSHTLEASNIRVPSGVSTSYSIKRIKDATGANVEESAKEGNSATLAGTYLVSVNFTISDTANYNNIDAVSKTLTINRADYTIEDACMYSASYTYDGTAKSITLSGDVYGTKPTLPAGVDVSYTYKMIKDKDGQDVNGEELEGNSVINAGTYEITAHFILSDVNYNEPDGLTAYLEIEPLVYDLGLSMTSVTVSDDGESHSISVTSTSAIPDTITISYTIVKTKDEDGLDVEEAVVVGNSAVEAGTYTIVATFSDTNLNYRTITSMSATLTITKVVE